jgi:hypothetical protein
MDQENGDFRVRWCPGKAHPDKKNEVAAETEGEWRETAADPFLVPGWPAFNLSARRRGTPDPLLMLGNPLLPGLFNLKSKR